MKIYTRRGDDGQTGLFGGGRVSKHDARVDAYGNVDELNAVLGWSVSQLSDAMIGARLETVQDDLFALGADLATPATGDRPRPETPPLPAARVDEMERWMDEADEELPELKAFILPSGCAGATALHVARTVCRRAERSVVGLAEGERVDPVVLRYLNRLSDLLFTFARLENHRAGAVEREWHPGGAG